MADGEIKLRTVDFELPPDVDLARARVCAAALEGFLSSVHNMKGITCPCGAETYPVWKTLDKGEVGYLNHKNTVNESHVVEMTDPRFKPIAESCQNTNDD